MTTLVSKLEYGNVALWFSRRRADVRSFELVTIVMGLWTSHTGMLEVSCVVVMVGRVKALSLLPLGEHGVRLANKRVDGCETVIGSRSVGRFLSFELSSKTRHLVGRSVVGKSELSVRGIYIA